MTSSTHGIERTARTQRAAPDERGIRAFLRQRVRQQPTAAPSLPVYRQMAQQSRDSTVAHQFGVTLAAKQHKTIRPAHTGLLPTQTVLLHPNSPPRPTQKIHGHAEFSNEFQRMRADGRGSPHQKKRRDGAGQMKNIRRNGAVCARSDINIVFKIQSGKELNARCHGIKEPDVLLFATNTKRNRYSS